MKEFIHGAKWWKFDFHNHTPKSFDFGRGDTTHMEITPENWLLMYMNAGIDCVAITDHNSGEWVDTLKMALAGMENANPKPIGYRKLFLFPGVEISASGNIHILALFDTSAGTAISLFSLSAAERSQMLYGKYICGIRVKLTGTATGSLLRFQLGGAVQTIANTDLTVGSYKQLYFVFNQDHTTKNSTLLMQKLATASTIGLAIDSIFIEPIHPAVLDR